MQILYIVRDHDKFPVWNHKLGTWGIDFDAFYGEDFNYRTVDGVKARLKKLRETKDYAGNPVNTPGLRLATRENLFKMLGVDDWAGDRWHY